MGLTPAFNAGSERRRKPERKTARSAAYAQANWCGTIDPPRKERAGSARARSPRSGVREYHHLMGVVLVNDGVALAARDQPAVHEGRRGEGDREADDDAPPEEWVAEAGVDRAGNGEHEQVVDQLHHRDGDGVR